MHDNNHTIRLGRRAFLKQGTLVLTSVSLGSSRLLAAEETPRVRIGLVTDLHYADKAPAGPRHYRETLEKLAEAARQFARDKPDFLVELGDFIDAADSVEVERRYLQTVNREFSAICHDRHYVLGNHCVDTLKKEEFLEGVGQERSYYSFDRGGIHMDWTSRSLPSWVVRALSRSMSAPSHIGGTSSMSSHTSRDDPTAASHPRRPVLAHPADAMNFLRALISPTLLIMPAVTSFPTNVPLAVFYGATIWFLLSDMNFILHQHIHCRLTTRPSINALLDLALSLTTGMSASCWRQHHLLRHHQSDDSWSRIFEWENRKFSHLGYVSYSLRYSISLIALPFVEAFLRTFTRDKEERRIFVHAFLEQSAVLSAIAFLVWLQPWFYGVYFFLTWFFTAAADYETHVGCEPRSPYGFSNNSLDPLYNSVRDNFGYHTAHHYFPSAHWTTLPELHRALEDKIPRACLSQRRWTGFLTPPLLAHALLHFLTRRGRGSREAQSVRGDAPRA